VRIAAAYDKIVEDAIAANPTLSFGGA